MLIIHIISVEVLNIKLHAYFFLFNLIWMVFGFFFFFQAEDGIRDKLVTGVQTCALPIWLQRGTKLTHHFRYRVRRVVPVLRNLYHFAIPLEIPKDILDFFTKYVDQLRDCRRSEERRVGKECRSRW